MGQGRASDDTRHDSRDQHGRSRASTGTGPDVAPARPGDVVAGRAGEVAGLLRSAPPRTCIVPPRGARAERSGQASTRLELRGSPDSTRWKWSPTVICARIGLIRS